jgi:lipid A disaccharide synthetase
MTILTVTTKMHLLKQITMFLVIDFLEFNVRVLRRRRRRRAVETVT